MGISCEHTFLACKSPGTFSLPLPQHPSRREAPVQPLFHPLLILCLSPEPSAALSFFPTIATFLGSTLFEEVQSPLKRAAMGGFCFVGAKGVLKIYHKQNQYIRQCKRQILDYHLP